MKERNYKGNPETETHISNVISPFSPKANDRALAKVPG